MYVRVRACNAAYVRAHGCCLPLPTRACHGMYIHAYCILGCKMCLMVSDWIAHRTSMHSVAHRHMHRHMHTVTVIDALPLRPTPRGQYMLTHHKGKADLFLSTPTLRGASFRSFSLTSSSQAQSDQVVGAAPPATAAATAPPTAAAAATAAVAAEDQVKGEAAPAGHLHLYQILSPKLVERAKHFGSTLALKDEWKCIDRPYFDAPGGWCARKGGCMCE